MRRGAIGILVVAASALCAWADPALVALTFDDGTKGNITEVAPLLKKFGRPAMFNIITDRIGTPGYMTWDDVRELHRQGFEIASHTLSHPNLLTLLSKGETNEVRRQIYASRDVIAKEVGVAPRFLCHPYLAARPSVDELIREYGMIPMFGIRFNVGGDAMRRGTPDSILDKLDRLANTKAKRRGADLLFHGTSPTSGGWNPLKGTNDFERILEELATRERKGEIRVVPYAEFRALYK